MDSLNGRLQCVRFLIKAAQEILKQTQAPDRYLSKHRNKIDAVIDAVEDELGQSLGLVNNAIATANYVKDEDPLS